MSLAGRALGYLLLPLGSRVVTIRSGPIAGARMELDLAHEKTFWAGTYEPEVTAVIEGLDLAGNAAWDVGAHAGYFSLALARRGARVVALEANHETAARLRRNAALNGGDIEIVEAAVAMETGHVWFDAVPGQRRAQSKITANGGLRVEAVTLDDLLDRHGAPAFVKMDIEGAELPSLRAAPRLLEAKPTILLEVHRERDESVLDALLSGAGYSVSWTGSRLLATP